VSYRALCNHGSRPDRVWNRILLENDYLPEDLERQVAALVAHYNHAERERIKRQTIQQRRLRHHMPAV